MVVQLIKMKSKRYLIYYMTQYILFQFYLIIIAMEVFSTHVLKLYMSIFKFSYYYEFKNEVKTFELSIYEEEKYY
jgi:hypothetical protein